MPWCEDCDRYLTPNSVEASGMCPTCGRTVNGAVLTKSKPGDDADEPQGGEEPTTVPWHFWLIVIPLVVYLGWRLVQGIGWIVN